MISSREYSNFIELIDFFQTLSHKGSQENPNVIIFLSYWVLNLNPLFWFIVNASTVILIELIFFQVFGRLLCMN